MQGSRRKYSSPLRQCCRRWRLNGHRSSVLLQVAMQNTLLNEWSEPMKECQLGVCKKFYQTWD
jgi:hypothetical protein